MADGNGNGAVRWQAWAGIIFTAILILASLVTYAVQINGAERDAADARQQAANLEARLATANARIEQGTAQITAIRENLKEIETQFAASDIVRNLMHANDLRVQSLLWQKVYGVPFPTDNAYYPSIANRPKD